MKRLGMLGVVVAVLSCSALTTVADELEAVQKKIVSAWEKHKSMTAKITVENTMPGAPPSSVEGTIEYLRQGDQYKSRVEVVHTMVMPKSEGDEKKDENKAESKPESKDEKKDPKKEEKKESRYTVVTADGVMHMLMDDGSKQEARKGKADQSDSVDPKSFLETLAKNATLKLLPEDTVNGKKVFAIEAGPKAESPMPVKMVCYFSQDDGVMLKMVMQDPQGKAFQTTTFSDVKFDVDINPERFTLKLPEGVKEVDQTAEQHP